MLWIVGPSPRVITCGPIHPLPAAQFFETLGKKNSVWLGCQVSCPPGSVHEPSLIEIIFIYLAYNIHPVSLVAGPRVESFIVTSFSPPFLYKRNILVCWLYKDGKLGTNRACYLCPDRLAGTRKNLWLHETRLGETLTTSCFKVEHFGWFLLAPKFISADIQWVGGNSADATRKNAMDSIHKKFNK